LLLSGLFSHPELKNNFKTAKSKDESETPVSKQNKRLFSCTIVRNGDPMDLYAGKHYSFVMFVKDSRNVAWIYSSGIASDNLMST
jgi:hypothetical protein